MTGRVMRASDQDRHEAVLALSDHYADGRLDHAEFESRMSAAQQATYLHELDPLFADLPVRAAPAPTPAAPAPNWRGRPRVPVLPVVLPLAIVAMVMTHGHALWLLLPLWWIALSVRGRRPRHGDWPSRELALASALEGRRVTRWRDRDDDRG